MGMALTLIHCVLFCDPGPCDHRTIYRIIYKGTRGHETGM